MCAIRESLGNVGRIEMNASLFIIFIVIYDSILCPTKEKEKWKKIALPTMW